MARAVRINLSVPAAVDALLKELATATGRGKASLVMEALGYQLPAWRRFLDRVKTGKLALSREEREDLARREISPLSRSRRVR
jgi:hypothetical protein